MAADNLLGFFQELTVDYSSSPCHELYSEQDLVHFATELKEVFNYDKCSIAQDALTKWRAHPGAGDIGGLKWFQRITLEGQGITTTSDHTLYKGENPGPLNTLWGRLTPIEGIVLRPLPKWAYLRKIMPSVRRKTVLEIGSACGFWPLKFAELGASFCTGIEVVQNLYEQAIKAARMNPSMGQVNFVFGDAYLDPSVPQHDIVFMSEVLIHSIFPDFSLLRALNLAKECLVIDDFIGRDDTAPAELHLMRDVRTGKITWTGFSITEKLFFKFLYAYGIEPSRVTRYRDPMGHHTVLVVDTRGIEEFRRKIIGHDSLHSSLRASMTKRAYAESLRNSEKAFFAPKPIESKQ